MTPHALKYYRHRYGGIYSVIIPESTNIVDQSTWVVYKHEWPFSPTKVYHRPYSEFTDGRFVEISGEELIAVFRRNREELQREIIANKVESTDDK